MPNYAILIDGGFVKRQLRTTNGPMNSVSIKELINSFCKLEVLRFMKLHRVYYYDSVPLDTSHQKPLGGELIEFGNSPIASQARKLFEELQLIPFVALRLGELSFNGWKIKNKKILNKELLSVEISNDDLKPNITQKGVDMRIGMDMAALTLKKQVDAIILVSADSDFVPAMKFVRREGAQVFIAPLGRKVKTSMIEHSDMVLNISLEQ
jgi:uncharacterized LabA/DUF88 family protein